MINENEVQHVETAIVAPNDALEQMERASIDVQIATAKKYPRSLSNFLEKAKGMVGTDLETAESCIYRRPVGKEDGKEVYAEGESIRLAEIVLSSYSNMRVGSIIVDTINPRYVKAIAIVHDLESNVAVKVEVVESTVTKSGAIFSERMRLVVQKSAQSKAIRDGTFRVIPKSLCKSLTDYARQLIAGKQRPLAQRRQQVLEWLKKLPIDGARVFNALGVAGVEEMNNEELETLTGLKTALKDGEITLEEAFPPIVPEEKKPGTKTEKLKDKLQQQVDSQPVPESSPAPPPPPEPEQPRTKYQRFPKVMPTSGATNSDHLDTSTLSPATKVDERGIPIIDGNLPGCPY